MNDHEQSLIEKYLDNRLTDEENIEFNEQVETSDSFASEVAFQKKMLAHLEANIKSQQKAKLLVDLQQIKLEDNNLQPVNETESRKEAKTIQLIPKKAWYGIAASLVILIGVFSILQLGGQTNDEVYLSYYQPYDGIVNTRGNNNVVEEAKPLMEIIALYNVGQYQIALDNFLKIEKVEGITDGQFALLIANCYLNLDQPANGLEWLAKISTEENSLVTANKDWYIAMCHIKANEIEKAKNKLSDIIDKRSIYTHKASKLLKEDIFSE